MSMIVICSKKNLSDIINISSHNLHLHIFIYSTN